MSTGKFRRITRQRQIILEELNKVTSHPTADEVYEMVRKRLPHISLGTVYRNLETLAEYGIIQKLDMCGVQMRFDGNPKLHYHVRCSVCGKVDDLPIDHMPAIDVAVHNTKGYDITDYKLEFIRVCPECKESNQSFTYKKTDMEEINGTQRIADREKPSGIIRR